MDDRLAPTIAAIATPPGPGGIGVIRVSGPAALPILHRLFSAKRQPFVPVSHRLYYGWIKCPSSGQVVDEVMAVYMAAPHSYTREDVVEMHCHSNFLILQEILALTQEAGARLAEPGEFTKRAFVNGRLDLSQAEAVLEVLSARCREGLQLAVNQLQGGLQEQIRDVAEALLRLRAVAEVAIDFPDEEVEILSAAQIRHALTVDILPALDSLIDAADNGRIYREGIAMVIVGRPNVGKSSLLNALLREERAIVTTQAGTTRDTIEEHIVISGLPVRIVDTAGIRDAQDLVEEIGIQRSKQKLREADVVLLLVDASQPLQAEDMALLGLTEGKPLLVVANKRDLCAETDIAALRQRFPDHPVQAIAAKDGTGIRDLEDRVFALVTGQGKRWDPGGMAAPNARQRTALVQTRTRCRQILAGLRGEVALDLFAIDVQTALDHLGEITGQTTTEDVLDRIFGEFCLGK